MIIKIFLVIAIACMAQVINAKDLNIQAQMTSETVMLWNRRDDFGPLMVLNEMEVFLEQPNPKTLKCYKKYFNFYKKFTRTYAQACTKLATECKKEFTENSKNLVNLIKLLKGISKLMTEYSRKMLQLMENKQNEEAVEYMNDSWFKLEFTETTILGTLKGLKNKNAVIATKGEKTITTYTKIRNEAKNKAAELLEKFEKCLEAKEK